MSLSVEDKRMIARMFCFEVVPTHAEIKEWVEDEPVNLAGIVLYEFVECFLKRKVNKSEHNYGTADEALIACWEEIWRLIDEHTVDIYG